MVSLRSVFINRQNSFLRHTTFVLYCYGTQ